MAKKKFVTVFEVSVVSVEKLISADKRELKRYLTDAVKDNCTEDTTEVCKCACLSVKVKEVK